MGLISKQALDHGYQNSPLHNDMKNWHIGCTQNSYPIHVTSYCEYNEFFNGFGADKMKYINIKIYCQINANICTIVFFMCTITIKLMSVFHPISSKLLYIGCF